MARLDHPNIVRVYGGCMSPPNLFVVEEIMVGDLAGHVHRRAPGDSLTLAQVIKLALDFVRGMVGKNALSNYHASSLQTMSWPEI